MATTTIKITHCGETVTLTANLVEASAPLVVDGSEIGRQTADARHRTDLAVALAARAVWPESEWPEVPSTGSIADDWSEGCEAWDDLEYVTISKSDVRSWETETTYVSTYPNGDEDGACDVEVQIGEAGGSWYLHTQDDAGGSDDADDTAYASEAAAREAAQAYADKRHEAQTGEDAEAYLARKLSERAGQPATDGEWAVYWSTVGDGSRVEARYETQDQAEAAATIANEQLHAANPGGQLLCGYEVRQMVDGEWVAIEAE